MNVADEVESSQVILHDREQVEEQKRNGKEFMNGQRGNNFIIDIDDDEILEQEQKKTDVMRG